MTNDTFHNAQQLLDILDGLEPDVEIYLLCLMGRSTPRHLKLDREHLRKLLLNICECALPTENIEGRFDKLGHDILRLVVGYEFYRGSGW
jgi:hypothetical protein